MKFPDGFEKRMKIQMESEWPSLKEALESEPSVSIRYNPLKFQKQQNEFSVPWCKDGFYLPQRPIFTLDPLLHAGAYYVQEASSMLIEKAINFISGDNQPKRVLDLCAAPGGKSTHLLSLLNSNSLLVSNEVIQTRVPVLIENLTKWGYQNSIVTNLDPKIFARLEGFFDIILVDAPCSGEGLFRKDPKAMNEWSEENASNCALRQTRILNDILPSLRPGGFIIYSTCTYNPSENQDQLQKMSNLHEMTSIQLDLVEKYGVLELSSNGIYGYQCIPNKTKGEGFFMGVMQKKSGEIKDHKINKKLNISIPKTIDSSQWLSESDNYVIFENHENEFSFIKKSLQHDVEIILSHIPVKKIGTHFITLKGKNILPTHGLALSVCKSPGLPTIEVPLQEALEYLRKNNLNIEYPGDGWKIVNYQGNALGWVNATSGRFNNKLPMEFRIRTL